MNSCACCGKPARTGRKYCSQRCHGEHNRRPCPVSSEELATLKRQFKSSNRLRAHFDVSPVVLNRWLDEANIPRLRKSYTSTREPRGGAKWESRACCGPECGALVTRLATSWKYSDSNDRPWYCSRACKGRNDRRTYAEQRADAHPGKTHCWRCKTWKPNDAFYQTLHAGECRDCVKAQSRERRRRDAIAGFTRDAQTLVNKGKSE